MRWHLRCVKYTCKIYSKYILRQEWGGLPGRGKRRGASGSWWQGMRGHPKEWEESAMSRPSHACCVGTLTFDSPWVSGTHLWCWLSIIDFNSIFIMIPEYFRVNTVCWPLPARIRNHLWTNKQLVTSSSFIIFHVKHDQNVLQSV